MTTREHINRSKYVSVPWFLPLPWFLSISGPVGPELPRERWVSHLCGICVQWQRKLQWHADCPESMCSWRRERVQDRTLSSRSISRQAEKKWTPNDMEKEWPEKEEDNKNLGRKDRNRGSVPRSSASFHPEPVEMLLHSCHLLSPLLNNCLLQLGLAGHFFPIPSSNSFSLISSSLTLFLKSTGQCHLGKGSKV